MAEETNRDIYRERAGDQATTEKAGNLSLGEEKEILEQELERLSREEKEQQTISKALPVDNDEEAEEIALEKEADNLREIKFEGRKIEHLLQVAKDKGADFAVRVAQKTNDACLLDLLHDRLVEQGIK